MKHLERFLRRACFRFPRIGLTMFLLLVLLLVPTPGAVHAAGVVAVCDEASLDAALAGGGLVTFTCAGTITITTTKVIAANTTIDGGGVITISGGGAVRVFYVNVGITLNLYNITVANGRSVADDGGGIYNFGGTVNIVNSTLSGNLADNRGGGIYTIGGRVSLTNSTLSGNSASAGNGGGIYNNGSIVTLTNSTLSGNSAFGDGGGIYNDGIATITNSTLSGNSAGTGGGIFNWQTVTITNSTLSGNSAGTGGGIYRFGGLATLTNTIVANHPAGGNCGGAITNGGGNLQFGDATCGAAIPVADPLLGGLANNGGPTQTMALGVGSPAINGAGACGLTNDQRGVARNDAACDIGAYEAAAAYTTPTVSFAAAASMVNEAVGGHLITVQLVVNPGPAVGEDVTVRVADMLSGTATSGADYTAFPLTTATFNCDVAPYCAPGTYTQTVTLNVIDDSVMEPAETVNLRIIGVTGPAISGAPVTHTVTITDNEATIGFGSAASTYTENAGTAVPVTLTVTSGPLAGPFSADIAYTGTATNGTDYTGLATVVFNAGPYAAGTYTLNALTLIDDALVEGNETVILTLSNPTGGATLNAINNPHTATITDNDTATIDFVSATDSVAENAGNHVTQVRLVTTVNGTTPGGGTLAPGVTINFNIARVNITTNAGDFTGATTAAGSFTAGATDGATAAITTPINDDAVAEGNENYRLDLTLGALTPPSVSVALGANTAQVVTIVDDDVPNVLVTESGGSTNVTEGGANDTFTVVLTTDPGATNVDVTLTVTDGQTQIGPVGGPYGNALTLTFTSANYNIPQTVEVVAVDDVAVEGAHAGTVNRTVTAGPANYLALNPMPALNVIIADNDIPPALPPASGGASSQPGIAIFDPAISKTGILMPGELGILGERLEWVVTVTNNGGAPGVNVVITDTLRPELQIDSVNSPVAYTISGQTVTVTIPVLNPGQSVTFSIFTTVLKSDVQVDNTACMARAGLDPLCASAGPLPGARVMALPATGETPWWVHIAVMVTAAGVVLVAGG